MNPEHESLLGLVVAFLTGMVLGFCLSVSAFPPCAPKSLDDNKDAAENDKIEVKAKRVAKKKSAKKSAKKRP